MNNHALSKSLHLLFLLLLSSPISTYGAKFGELGKPFWLIHGTLMFLAWGLIFPLGALIPVFRGRVGSDSNNGSAWFTWAPNFYLPHLYFQSSGFLLHFVAVTLAAWGCRLEYGTGNPFEEVIWAFETDKFPWNRHVKWGVAMSIILLLQCMLGYVHHRMKHAHDEKVKHGDRTRWKRPIVPSWAHVIIGPLAIIAAILTIVQGLQLFAVIYGHSESSPHAAVKYGYPFVYISAILFGVAYLYGRVASAMGTSSSSPDGDNPEARPSVEITPNP